jgi:hypothetical protein
MIRTEFSEEEMKKLNHERYHHSHPQVQKKMEVLYLNLHLWSLSGLPYSLHVPPLRVLGHLKLDKIAQAHFSPADKFAKID